MGKSTAAATLAVAIDRDKNSGNALKWAVDNLAVAGQTIHLIHVTSKVANQDEDAVAMAKELFRPYRCFCTRKDVQCNDIVLEDTDVAKAIIEFVGHSAIEKLVLGAASRGGFVRFKSCSDTSTVIFKGVPDFCSVYIISKGNKVQTMRNAIRPAPNISPLRQYQNMPSLKPDFPQQLQQQQQQQQQQQRSIYPVGAPKAPASPFPPAFPSDERESIKSPFGRGGRYSNTGRSYGELSMPDSDISFVSSDRNSVDRMLPPRLSTGSSDAFGSGYSGGYSGYEYRPAPAALMRSFDGEEYYASTSFESSSAHSVEDVEAEMKRLRLELKQTMDMYSSACKEALTAKNKAMELQRWKVEGQQKLEEARLSEEAALALAEMEKAKCKAAMEAAEASQRIAELEAQKRISAEKKALKDEEGGGNKPGGGVGGGEVDFRYRKYTIEEIERATEFFAENRKIGEGGYGPVYQCSLDHTAVAVKVLRPDAAQGRTQFRQEVEILCCIRHPNMVLLLGACPEYGCLVYEYMANGSLEDRLYRRGNTPSIPWQHRFRIAAEIGTGLLFLHQTKPEPLVHRDLKPANILLDRNYVSKISDVGLARLVPPSVADTVTQYRMTSAAGTFCYIDPEYQQTGMLGIKSDIYSLGVILLQILTGRPAMGLAHHVDRSIERSSFGEMLDSSVPDWPEEEALRMARMALRCAELRRKDRPDLAGEILPVLNRLRALAEDKMPTLYGGGGGGSSTGFYSVGSQFTAASAASVASGQPSPVAAAAIMHS